MAQLGALFLKKVPTPLTGSATGRCPYPAWPFDTGPG